MPSTTHTNDETHQAVPPPSRGRSRLIVLFTLLLLLVSIAVLPPLVNLGRFQKRIANNIGNALGRPVHFDHVALMLFPLPGFTLDNFVIDEDPAFGYEPVLRADQVDVTLRISSLWHTQVEFSKISFTAPSVNLVHANGRWNIESLLLHASHTQAAPTAQRFAGPARRFPYIEATGARLNLKLEQSKSPVSLTDTDFALWLPEPRQWHLRLEAHPERTDSSPGETGTIRAEGTLGGPGFDAPSLAQIPINLQGTWRDAQLGGIGGLILGRDPGLRGDVSLSFALNGTIGENNVLTRIQLEEGRRADFVPDHLLALEASCNGIAGNTFHSFTDIECHWPPPDSSDPPTLAVTANVPDVHQPSSATVTVSLPSLPADTFFDLLSVATPHPPAVLAGAGTLAGSLTWGIPPAPPVQSAAKHRVTAPAESPLQPASPALTGEIHFSSGSLSLDPGTNRSLPLGEVVLASTSPALPPARAGKAHTAPAALPAPDTFTLQPIPLALGGAQPATLEGSFNASGYTLHLTGTVLATTLLQMANAVPQFGAGLEPLLNQIAASTNPAAATQPAPGHPPAPAAGTAAQPTPDQPAPAVRPLPTTPIHVDLTATRAWGGPQTWTQSTPPPATHPHSRTQHRPSA